MVMVVVTMMVTGLGGRYNAGKHSQCNNCEHQVTNLHGILLDRVTPREPGLRLAYRSDGWTT